MGVVVELVVADVDVVAVVLASLEDEVIVAPEVVAGLTDGATFWHLRAACASALQYAAGEVLTELLNPKPPDRIGRVREVRASFGRGFGSLSLVDAVSIMDLSKNSAVGSRTSGFVVRVR